MPPCALALTMALMRFRATSTLADRVVLTVFLGPIALLIATTVAAHRCPAPGWVLFILFPLLPLAFLVGGWASCVVGAFARRKRAIVGGIFEILVCCPASIFAGFGLLISLCGGIRIEIPSSV